MKLKYKFNIFTGNFDLINLHEEQSSNALFYTRFVCGKIKDIEEGFYNTIDACSLPFDKNKNILDLGSLDELCN